MTTYGDFVRKCDGKLITDKLKERGPMGYNELFHKMSSSYESFSSKGTFENRISYLIEKELIDKETSPPDKKSRILIKLSPKAMDPRYATLRKLEISAGPHSSLDAEEAKDILTEEVAQILSEISSFVFKSKEGFVLDPAIKKPVYNPVTGEIIAPEGEPIKSNIDEFKFLKGITRYGVEVECFRHPADYMSQPNAHIEGLVIEKMVEKREDVSYFPALGTISKKSSRLKKDLEKLHNWSKPLRYSLTIASNYIERESTKHLIRINELLENIVKNVED